MDWKSFIQLDLGFLSIAWIIAIFQVAKLEITFIVTFILAIFSMAISLYFFVRSNDISNEIKERLTVLAIKFDAGLDRVWSSDNLFSPEKINKEYKKGLNFDES